MIRVKHVLNHVWFSSADKQGGDRYVLASPALNARAAREHCRTHYTDLVSIRNAAENQVVQEVAAGHNVWIGLFKDAWRWSDGRYSSFRFWFPSTLYRNPPTTYCGGVGDGKTGRWSRMTCSELNPFLCTCKQASVFWVYDNVPFSLFTICCIKYIYMCVCVCACLWQSGTKKRVLKVKVRSEDLQDPNDPATKAAILKQVSAFFVAVLHAALWNPPPKDSPLS